MTADLFWQRRGQLEDARGQSQGGRLAYRYSFIVPFVDVRRLTADGKGVTSKPAWPQARIDPDSSAKSEFLRGFSAVREPTDRNGEWLTDRQHVDASGVVKIDIESLTYQTEPLRSTLDARHFYASVLHPSSFFEMRGQINQRAIEGFKSIAALVKAMGEIPMLVGAEKKAPRQLFNVGYELADIYRRSTTLTGADGHPKDLVRPVRPLLMMRVPLYLQGELAGYRMPKVQLEAGVDVHFVKNDLCDIYIVRGGPQKSFYDEAMLLLARLHIERETLLSLLVFLARQPTAFGSRPGDNPAALRKFCMDSAKFLTQSQGYGYSLNKFATVQKFLVELHREDWRLAMTALERLDQQLVSRVNQVFVELKVEGDFVGGDQFRDIRGSNIANRSAGANVGSKVEVGSTDADRKLAEIIALLKAKGTEDEAALGQALEDSLGSPTQKSVGSAIWDRIKQLGIVVSNFGSGLTAVDNLFS